MDGSSPATTPPSGAQASPRPWRRLHASTGAALLLAAAVLILLNIPGQYVPHVGMPLDDDHLTGDNRMVRERLEHGWPFKYLIRDDRFFVDRPGETEYRNRDLVVHRGLCLV
jgi:hypothetical protein